MRYGWLWYLLLSSWTWSESSPKSAIVEKDAEVELIQLLERVKALQGQFTQAVKTGDTLEQQSGHFALQKPDKLKWEVVQPWSQLLIADGTHIWFYDKDLEQITRHSRAKFGNNPAMFLLQAKSVSQYYSVSRIPRDRLDSRSTATASESGDASFQGGPSDVSGFLLLALDKDAIIETIQLIFINKTLSELRFNDSLGQQTDIRLSLVEIDPILEQTLFQFKIPSGMKWYDSH